MSSGVPSCRRVSAWRTRRRQLAGLTAVSLGAGPSGLSARTRSPTRMVSIGFAAGLGVDIERLPSQYGARLGDGCKPRPKQHAAASKQVTIQRLANLLAFWEQGRWGN